MKFWAPQPRQPFVGLALSAMLGILIADRWPMSPLWAFAFSALGLLALLLRPATLTCWLFCATLFLELHAVRHTASDAHWLAGILDHNPRVVHATGIVWNEPEKPATWSRTVTVRFLLKAESISSAGQTLPSDLRINVAWAGTPPVYGDRVVLTGGATNLEPVRNPGQFDAKSYQQRLGVYSEIEARFAGDCRIESHGHGNPLQAFAFAARHWVQKRLEFDLGDSPEIVAIIDGVVLGLRGESPEDLKMLLQRTGTIHLFVVSGLNIAMLATIAYFLLKPFGLPRSVVVVLLILLLVTYTLITGLRTSSVRSTIMASLLLAAPLFDRRAVSYNSLAAAAFVLLIWNTNELFAPGFQFSFTLVFIIIACATRLQRGLESLAQPDPFLPRVLWTWPVKCGAWCWHRLCVAIGLLVASWIGSLVFTVGYFHLFSPASLLANALAVPLAFALLALGLASVLAAAISLHATVLFNNANWFFAKWMLWVLHTSADLPGGFIYVERPHLSAAPICELTAFDLAEGGAAYVRGGGADWLLDCGDQAHYEHVVLPCLRSRGVNQLDGLLLTHGSVKHIGGALTAITDFRPSLLADSILRDRSRTRKHVHDELESRHLGKGLYARGDFVHLGHAATLRVLYPLAGIKRSTADDMALVLQLQAGATRVLLMSDSGFATEQWLLENEPDLHSDIVIKGQHSSDVSGMPDFLARVAPRVIICGTFGYGVPVEKLDAWEKEAVAQNITVFRQDKTGAVHIDIRRDGFDVRGFVNNQTFRSLAR